MATQAWVKEHHFAAEFAKLRPADQGNDEVPCRSLDKTTAIAVAAELTGNRSFAMWMDGSGHAAGLI